MVENKAVNEKIRNIISTPIEKEAVLLKSANGIFFIVEVSM